MRLVKRLRRSAVYHLAKWALRFLNWIPRKSALYLGEWLALAAWWVLGKSRYKAERHLSLVYGDSLTMREKSNIGRAFFVNSGKNLSDALRFRSHIDEIRQLVTVEGLDHFAAAMARGKGVLGITGHIGNFELLAAHIAGLGYPIAVIGRELYEPRLNRLLIENREATGLTNISTTDSPKRIMKWLRSGGGLGVLIDNDSHRIRGMFIPAFGRWSYTPIGQTLLGLKVGAAFVPMACIRKPDDTYHVIIRPPIEFKSSGDSETDTYNVTLACTRELEKIILAYPDQWAWHHNRWRTRMKSPLTDSD